MPSIVQADRIRRAILLASAPAVVLAVCPMLASPFVSAKTSALFIFGACACWFLRDKLEPKGPAPESAQGPGRDRLPSTVLLICLAGWLATLLTATLAARGWAVGWRPIAEMASALGVAVALRRFGVGRRQLITVVAASSLVLSIAALVGWCGFDLPGLLGGNAAAGRMRSAATLGNPLFVASFLSSAGGAERDVEGPATSVGLDDGGTDAEQGEPDADGLHHGRHIQRLYRDTEAQCDGPRGQLSRWPGGNSGKLA